MSVELILGLAAFITSIVAGVVGFGGGLMLIAILPIYLNPALIIPIHGVNQLASNSSRMLFSLGSVQWALLPRFLLGSFIGAGLLGFVVVSIPSDYIPLAIGIYLLLNLWCARFSRFISRYENYYVIGFLQTGLGLVVGATGPLALSVLTKNLTKNDEVIATSAMFMTISHLAKVLVFGFVGFSLFEHAHLLLFMVVGSVMGSFVGTQCRRKVDNEKLMLAIKILLTLLALRMVVAALW